MPRIQTAGTHSCSQISIGDFYTVGGQVEYESNEAYLNDKERFNPILEDDNMDIREFSDKILMPTEQELGRTKVYAFDYIMDQLDHNVGDLGSKFITVNLNSSQQNYRDGYWLTRLKERGFEKAYDIDNEWGQKCSLFVRNYAAKV